MSKNDQNKIQAKESDYLYIQTSQLPNSGNGLFTAIEIFKEEIISVFYGEILTSEKSKIRTSENRNLHRRRTEKFRF